jgi:hypothetical protein
VTLAPRQMAQESVQYYDLPVSKLQGACLTQPIAQDHLPQEQEARTDADPRRFVAVSIGKDHLPQVQIRLQPALQPSGHSRGVAQSDPLSKAQVRGVRPVVMEMSS